jgi:tRNA pseudouridine55 synthase
MTSDTEDSEGDVQPLDNAPAIDKAQLAAVLPQFNGNIQQLPPKFSALKVNGKRAYELARAGKEVKLQPREITIHSIRVVDFQYPYFTLEIVCGTGTYIRSLGRDIGAALGSAAIMTALERTAIGDFSIETSASPEQLTRENIQSKLFAPQHCLKHLDQLKISDEEAGKLLDGTLVQFRGDTPPERAYAVDQQEQLLAILQRREGNFYSPKVNFCRYWRDLRASAN